MVPRTRNHAPGPVVRSADAVQTPAGAPHEVGRTESSVLYVWTRHREHRRACIIAHRETRRTSFWCFSSSSPSA